MMVSALQLFLWFTSSYSVWNGTIIIAEHAKGIYIASSQYAEWG